MVDHAVPIVPTVRWRCPSCGHTKPRTYGHRGKVRLHQCPCGRKFRSIELDPDRVAEALSARRSEPAVATELSAEQIEELLPLAELAQLLRAPEAAILNGVRVDGARRGCLLEAGFPAPVASHEGQPAWNRREVLVHLSDPTRKTNARRIAITQGLAGTGVFLVPEAELPRIARARKNSAT